MSSNSRQKEGGNNMGVRMSSNTCPIPIPIPIQIPTQRGNGNDDDDGDGHINQLLHIEESCKRDISIPCSSNMNFTLNINASSNSGSLEEEDHMQKQQQVMVMTGTTSIIRYMECMKNHAAAIGGNATDGCGEFMPGGQLGTLEALHCSACNCHRNFHRKLEIHSQSCNNNGFSQLDHVSNATTTKLIFGHNNNNNNNNNKDDDDIGAGVLASHPELIGYPTTTTTTGTLLQGTIVSSDGHLKEDEGMFGGVILLKTEPPPPPPPNNTDTNRKKRFRTKFSKEQKEKMSIFAEKVGWKIQNVEDSAVQQFCQEIGIKRRVLKVWMHNNHHHHHHKK